MAGNFFSFREIRIMKEVEMILQTCEMSERRNKLETWRIFLPPWEIVFPVVGKKNHSNKYIQN